MDDIRTRETGAGSGHPARDTLNDLVAQFLMITSVEDTSKALQMLEATGHDLQAAVELYFAADQFDADAVTRRGGGPDPIEEAHPDGDVRAPIPTMMDRLYGDEVGAGHLETSHDRNRRRRGGQDSFVHQPIMDAFRTRIPGQRGEESHGDALPSMFEPPKNVLYSGGDFQDAAERAQKDHTWLILNIQSPSNFDSHRLNRDTWRDSTLQAILQTSFIVYQTYDVAEEGIELIAAYGVTEFPVILIVDPVTGAPMKRWSGFVDAARLAEDLVPFMDTPFDDPGAACLAASSFRKKYGESVQSLDSLPSAPAEEVPALQKHKDKPTNAAPSEQCEDIMSKEQAMAIQDEALVSLPEENESNACKMAIRLPDGKRIQRKFPRDCPVSALSTWCISQSLDAAAGKEFVLTQSVPGAQNIDIHAQMSIEEAGIADCMLQMRWKANP